MCLVGYKSLPIQKDASVGKWIALAVSAYIALASQLAHAQLEETRYMVVNNTVMTFKVPVAPVAPVTPVFYYLISGGPHAATMNWSGVPGATHYKIETSLPNSSIWSTLYEGNTAPYTAVDLIAGSHSFRISSCGNDLCSEPSVVGSILIEQDTDRDGVTDANDLCIGTALQASVGEYGCSEAQLLNLSGGDGGNSGQPFQCIDPITDAASNDPNCPEAQRDSDFDGTVDGEDPYPFQGQTQCVP